jgi:CRISPR/Cas system CSM-associated protein Csm3 (group 7 of RAMP superfamily)
VLNQVRFTARVKLLSDLHIGTGESWKFSDLRPEVDVSEEKDAEVAVVFRCCNSKPALPATSIKGALRRRLDDREAKRLFGEIKNTETKRVGGEEQDTDTGSMGTVWLRLAKLKENPDHPGDLPFWRSDQCSYIASHVAIDRRTGAASRQKLFFVERIPAGAEFELRGVALGELEECKSDILKALTPLMTTEGLPLGADERFGAGRAKLIGEISCTRWWFDAASGEVRSDENFELPPLKELSRCSSVKTLRLFCEGPYITIDPSKSLQGEHKNELVAARRSDTAPLLPETSLMGVLRSRAAWLARTDAVADGDEPFRKPNTWKHPGGLTRVERLFGVSGWRGLVRLIEAAPQEGAPHPLPKEFACVSIDRFTGGCLDSALYKIKAFTGAAFIVKLALKTRKAGGQLWPGEADRRLFDDLLDDLLTDGLLLGFGVNRGFGWFSADQINNS